MSSALTLYPNNPLQSSSSAGKLDTTAPTASTSTTGWTVGTTSVSFPYSLLSYNAEKANFSSGALPSGGPVTAAAHFAQDCWRLSSVTSGTFSAGTWYSSLSLLAVTAGGAQDGNARYRIYRASSASGAAATQLTAGTMVGTVVTNLSTTVAQSSSASTQIGSVTLTDEYLFLQVAWQITGAGNNAGDDVLVRLGPLTNITNGSFLVTPQFTGVGGGGGGAVPGAGYYNEYYNHLVQDLT